MGVYVFFVLSGYLITGLLLDEESRRSKVSLPAFLLRREFRIVPAYYATIAVYGLITLSPAGRAYAGQFTAGLWLWLAYCGDIAATRPAVGSLLGHSWSLAIEQRFYLVWPLVIFSFCRLQRLRIALLTAALFVTASLQTFYFPSYFALLLGCAVAFATSHSKTRTLLSKCSGWIVCVLPVALGIVLNWYPNIIDLFSASVALLIAQLSTTAGAANRVLGWSPLTWLGRRSYSFYLYHVICLNVVLRIIPTGHVAMGVLAIVLGAMLTAAVAAISFRWIEEPFRTVGKQLCSRLLARA